MFDFINLPYIVCGDFKLAESFAVHQFIAQKFKPELLGETPQERGRNYQLQSIANDNFITFMKLGFMKEEKSYTANYCFRYMEKFVKHLGDKKYLNGDKLCIADFIFFEHIEFG